MSKELDRQIDEFSEIGHALISKTYSKEFKSKYPSIEDISPLELGIVAIICKKENTIMKDILEIMKIPKSTLTSTIDRMEKKDILKRKTNPNDKRSYILVLTKKGQTLKKEHDAFEKMEFKRIIECLDTYEERQMFIDLLNKVSKKL